MSQAVEGMKHEWVTIPLHAHVYCEECGTVPKVGDELFSDERDAYTLYFCSEDCADDYIRREACELFGPEHG